MRGRSYRSGTGAMVPLPSSADRFTPEDQAALTGAKATIRFMRSKYKDAKESAVMKQMAPDDYKEDMAELDKARETIHKLSPDDPEGMEPTSAPKAGAPAPRGAVAPPIKVLSHKPK